MFKMIMGLFLASIFLVGCSKTNPTIEVKEKVIEKNLRTYDALTASQDMQLSDEADLDLIINNIRSKRQINFDWKAFWVKTSENIGPIQLSETIGRKLFSLSKLSCEEAPTTSFLIFQYVEKGLEQEMKLASPKAGHWLSYLQTVVQDCHLAERDAFMFRYKDILKNILLNGDKKLKVLAISDLNKRISTTENSLLLKLSRELFFSDKKLLNIPVASISEVILLAHVFKDLFPYQANPYLELILSEADILSTAQYYEDLAEALIMLSRIEIPQKKLPQMTDFLIDLWSKNNMPVDSLSNEEKLNYFHQQYALTEVLMSFLERELIISKNKIQTLNKAEKVIRNLEILLFSLPHPDDVIIKRGKEEINLMLDLRHAKKTGEDLNVESSPVENIKKLSDVMIAFHRMHDKGDSSSQIKLFCDWVDINKVNSINKDSLVNGCYEITSNAVGQKLKVETDSFKTPLFSVIKFSGDFELKAKKIDLGVIDLSQSRVPEASPVRFIRELEAIAFPLVMGFELSEDFLGAKKDKLYFFPYQYVYRHPSAGLPHIGPSASGLNGGNLILKNVKKSDSYMPSFISNGGKPAPALKGNSGGRVVSYGMDIFKMEEWLSSSSAGEIFPLDTLSAKNLKSFLSKIKKNYQYKTIIKVESDVISYIGQDAVAVFEESLKLAREIGVLTSDDYLEELSSLAMNSLAEEIDFKISHGESFSRLSSLDTFLELSAASSGDNQQLGQPGAKGVVIYE